MGKSGKRQKYLPPASGGSFAVAPKAWGLDFLFSPFAENAEAPSFTEEGGYAVVAIDGPLEQKASWWCDSYDAIRDRAQAAFDSSSPAVCLRIHSPGGDYAGCLELAQDIRDMADVAGKPLVAFTDGDMLSAAFAIGCAADEIVGTPSSQLGSVGVWAALLDVTAADAAYGMKFLIVASGTAKADRNPHTPMTKEAAERLRAQVDVQASTFIAHVASRRSVAGDVVRALEGAEVSGADALASGLCDRVFNSWSAFLTSEKEDAMPVKIKGSKLDEAKGILSQLAEDGSDDEKKDAKKMLKALEPEEEEPKDDKKDKEAKASDDEETKKKDEEAKASSANSLALAKDVAALTAKLAERDARDAASAVAQARAGLFAQRPDFSEAQRKTLAAVPLAVLEDAVKSWPRASAQPGAAASALTPVVSGGGEPTKAGYQPRLTPDQQKWLDKQSQTNPDVVSAKVAANALTMPEGHITQEQAARRAAELQAQLAELGKGV